MASLSPLFVPQAAYDSGAYGRPDGSHRGHGRHSYDYAGSSVLPGLWTAGMEMAAPAPDLFASPLAAAPLGGEAGTHPLKAHAEQLAYQNELALQGLIARRLQGMQQAVEMIPAGELEHLHKAIGVKLDKKG